jgi:hypothetical protein
MESCQPGTALGVHCGTGSGGGSKVAFDEGLAIRVRKALGTDREVREQKMFGGLCFLLNGNMCCGIVGETLMVRVGKEAYEEALARPHAREMDFTGKPLRGMVYVDPGGIAEDGDLEGWIQTGVGFAESLPRK